MNKQSLDNLEWNEEGNQFSRNKEFERHTQRDISFGVESGGSEFRDRN